MPRSYFLINLILLIIIGLLGFKFYKVWVSPLDISTNTSQQQFQTDKKSLVDRKEVNLDEAAYHIIVQKDLFRPSRSALRANTSKVSFSKGAPKLFGTMIKNNEKSAILEDPFTKTTKLYHINDSVAGFIVLDIQKDKVILLRGGESIEVRLRDVKVIKPLARKPPLMPSSRRQRNIRRTPPPPSTQRSSARPKVTPPSPQKELPPFHYEE